MSKKNARTFIITGLLIIFIGQPLLYADPDLLRPLARTEQSEMRAIKDMIDIVWADLNMEWRLKTERDIGHSFNEHAWYIATHNMDSDSYGANLKAWCAEFFTRYFIAKANLFGVTLERYLDEYLKRQTREREMVIRDFKYALFDSYSLPAVTALFHQGTDWLADLENYFDQLIEMKDNADDRTIRWYSIGCAAGEEAYSMAAVLYDRLMIYAMKYKRMSEAEAVDWIRRDWDTVIWAADVCIFRLAVIKSGKVIQWPSDVSAWELNPAVVKYGKYFTPAGSEKSGKNQLVVSDAIRRMVKPFYINASMNANYDYAVAELVQDKANGISVMWLTGSYPNEMLLNIDKFTDSKYPVIYICGTMHERITCFMDREFPQKMTRSTTGTVQNLNLSLSQI